MLTNAFGSALGEALLPAVFDTGVMRMHVGSTLGGFRERVLGLGDFPSVE